MLTLNYRGVSNKDIYNRIRGPIRAHNLKILWLVETLVDIAHVHRFYSRFHQKLEGVDLHAATMSRGILIFWQCYMGIVTPQVGSRRALYLVISSSFLDVWILIIVCDSENIERQKKIWSELSNIANLNLPWLI